MAPMPSPPRRGGCLQHGHLAGCAPVQIGKSRDSAIQHPGIFTGSGCGGWGWGREGVVLHHFSRRTDTCRPSPAECGNLATTAANPGCNVCSGVRFGRGEGLCTVPQHAATWPRLRPCTRPGFRSYRALASSGGSSSETTGTPHKCTS
eukprot:gene8909-biopygen6160